MVIVPGSGPTDRDGNGPGLSTDLYRLLAEGLAQAGIASIRIDKRGVGFSAGAIADGDDVTIAAMAQDLRDWVVPAARLAPCVWIAGHSEGGLVALAAAQEPPPGLCGLILMAAPGQPLGRILVQQFRTQPWNAPLAPAVEAAVAELEAGRPVVAEELPAPLRPLFRASVQPYLMDLMAQDPAALAAGWAGRALIVQGDADIQVGMAQADALAAAMPQAERLTLEGATHVLKAQDPANPLATYADPALPLHPGLVPGIAAFLNSHPPP